MHILKHSFNIWFELKNNWTTSYGYAEFLVREWQINGRSIQKIIQLDSNKNKITSVSRTCSVSFAQKHKQHSGSHHGHF